jgi:hypothetical protein
VDCPSDARQPNTFACRAAAGACDLPELCDGSVECPFDAKISAATECRASAGPCDVAESCDGLTNACPANQFVSAATVCRGAQGGPCDAAESCDGVGPDCPADSFRPANAVCRAAAGVCDAPETCSGASPDCPVDAKRPVTFVCRPANGVCDYADVCTGGSDTCPGDLFLNNTTVCRPAATACDAVERCTGASTACPSDAFATATTVCRASTSTCDPQETCTGNSPICPTDVAQPSSNCEPYACVSATTCRNTCTTDAECGPSKRSICRAGLCIAAKLVFVSSTTYATAAALGGIAGADTRCQTAATAASLGGTWKFWGPGSDTRLTQATVPYILTAGKVRIANNWADLVDGTLANPIGVTEFGVTLPTANGEPPNVFTGATSAGASTGLTCANFTLNTANGGSTYMGSIIRTTQWSEPFLYPCITPSRIFCFEQ